MSEKKSSASKEKHRSKSQTKSSKHSGWNNDTEIIVVEDDGTTDKLFAKTKKIHKSSMPPANLNNRPPFNLDTRIEGYEDVDENGRYKPKKSDAPVTKSQQKKSQIKQQELNEQWAESLRDNFYHQ